MVKYKTINCNCSCIIIKSLFIVGYLLTTTHVSLGFFFFGLSCKGIKEAEIEYTIKWPLLQWIGGFWTSWGGVLGSLFIRCFQHHHHDTLTSSSLPKTTLKKGGKIWNCIKALKIKLNKVYNTSNAYPPTPQKKRFQGLSMTTSIFNGDGCHHS